MASWEEADFSAETWDQVVWPDWVPETIRAQIASLWGPSCYRKPADYARILTGYGGYPEVPELHFAELAIRKGPGIEKGRYVHMGNNIGRIVFDDGSSQVVSCHHGETGNYVSSIRNRDEPDYCEWAAYNEWKGVRGG